MIDSSIIFQFIIVQISFAFTPGLIIALVANESSKNGRKKGIEVAIGAAFGAIVLTLISSLVVSFVFSIIPLMTTVVYFVGSIYIVLKGIETLRSVSDQANKNIEEKALIAGFKVNLLNPKMWVLFLTVLPIFITTQGNYFINLLFLGLLTVVINLVADIAYAFMSSYFFYNSSERTKNIINKICGISLITIGAYLFLSRFF
jgi:threonine/homoserine/homoserine lactone efflux protein